MLDTVWRNPWVQAPALALGMIGLGFAVYALSFVLIPLLLAFLGAYILNPLVDWFEARHVPRSGTIFVLAFAAFAFFIAVPLFAIPSIVRQTDQMISTARQAGEPVPAEEGALGQVVDWAVNQLPLDEFVSYMGWRAEYEQRLKATQDTTPDQAPALEEEPSARIIILDQLTRWIKQNIRGFLDSPDAAGARRGVETGAPIAPLFQSLGEALLNAVVFLANLALFGFVAGYLLRDFHGIVEHMKELIPPRWRNVTYRIAGKIHRQLQGFLVGQLTVCVILAVMYAIGLGISQVPFFILIALFGGVMSLVPYIGVGLTFIPAATLVLLNPAYEGQILAVIATFVVVQSLEGNLVTPVIMGDRVGLHPVWVILAVTVFSGLMGFKGMLMAIPLSAVLKVLIVEAVQYYRTSSIFAADRDSAAPPASESSRPPG